ncbi:MAG: thiaminase II [Bacillota bacterium]|uniref:Aminopyrimidine aminohydrolase n=1 Tax=Virgibacillus salarius TaxID=447199 RepID=A0A941DVS0_9BACI|nr:MULTISPECIES: thiaminase II [Bacillaceae]NAZ09335.1 thiaminase II [Agaribacter marinus]MBR7796626.1 thiaminase II [Virgibacillus salarius]MCC2251357.1 thiaminase II [Virgibacillus sp. AGTR]MDY7043817.1 thiaminase II [Virgibacillus sp. M23]QRZ19468.1 thiaminase II [Virgibacillus sp. AGTR]
MNFTDQLREENNDIFQLIFNHPFVQGIGTGEISKDALAHYIKADFEYLNAFMQIYGIALSKSKKRDDIAYFFDQINFILNDEIHPHHNFCNHIGVDYASLQGHPLPPTADHYIKHMMYHAQMGTSSEILGALLPCPWTYLEIGRELMEQYNPNKDHPFYDWISFYASGDVDNTTFELRKRLDILAENAAKDEKDLIREAFRKSCQLELKFWEMAYTCESWPNAEKVNS